MSDDQPNLFEEQVAELAAMTPEDREVELNKIEDKEEREQLVELVAEELAKKTEKIKAEIEEIIIELMELPDKKRSATIEEIKGEELKKAVIDGVIIKTLCNDISAVAPNKIEAFVKDLSPEILKNEEIQEAIKAKAPKKPEKGFWTKFLETITGDTQEEDISNSEEKGEDNIEVDLTLLKESQLVELAIRMGSPLSKSNIRANRIPKIIQHIQELVADNGKDDELKELFFEMKDKMDKIDAQESKDEETQAKAKDPDHVTPQQKAAQSARDARVAQKEDEMVIKLAARQIRINAVAKKKAKAKKEKGQRLSSAKKKINPNTVATKVLKEAIVAKQKLQGYPTYISAINNCISRLQRVIR